MWEALANNMLPKITVFAQKKAPSAQISVLKKCVSGTYLSAKKMLWNIKTLDLGNPKPSLKL